MGGKIGRKNWRDKLARKTDLKNGAKKAGKFNPKILL